MSTILKAAPDVDLYCDWSTIVDAPKFIGPLKEMYRHLAGELSTGAAPEDVKQLGKKIAEVVARATVFGSSDLNFIHGGFEDAGLVVQDFDNVRLGWLPRDRFTEFFTLYPTDRPAANALLDEITED